MNTYRLYLFLYFIAFHKMEGGDDSRGMEGELVVGLIGLEFSDSSGSI